MLSLIRSEWRFLLFGFLMTFWSSPGQTYFVSLFSAEIRSALSLSDGQFGGIYSIATLLSAFVIIWSGTLIDKLELPKITILSVVGLAIGCCIISFSTNIVILIIGVFLLRQMGQGLMCLTSSTAMVRYLSNHKGKASALGGIGYAVSEALMPSVLVIMIAYLGWRTSWLVSGIVLVVAVIPVLLYLLKGHHERHAAFLSNISNDSDVKNQDEKPQDEKPQEKQRQWTRSEVVRDKRFYLFLPGLMSQQLMFTGFIFHQVHLVESKGWSLSAWASFFAVYAVVSVCTKLVIGVLVDRFGAIRMVPLVGLPMGVGLYILATTSELWWGGAFLVLTGITVGFQSTVSAPFFSEMYGNQHLGSIKSLAAAIMVMFTATSPVVLGVFIDMGVSIETLAMASAIYILVTSSLAYYAYVLTRRSHSISLNC